MAKPYGHKPPHGHIVPFTWCINLSIHRFVQKHQCFLIYAKQARRISREPHKQLTLLFVSLKKRRRDVGHGDAPSRAGCRKKHQVPTCARRCWRRGHHCTGESVGVVEALEHQGGVRTRRSVRILGPLQDPERFQTALCRRCGASVKTPEVVPAELLQLETFGLAKCSTLIRRHRALRRGQMDSVQHERA